MYRIYADGKLLYAPELAGEGYGVAQPELTAELNKAGSLSFNVPITNVLYNELQKLSTTITVEQDGKQIWKGRILNSDRDFYRNKATYCEGELAFLNDGIVAPYDYTTGGMSVGTYLETLVNQYLEQCSEGREIYPGKTSYTDTIYRGSEDYVNCLQELSNKLPSLMGGYLLLRHEGEKTYLDFLLNPGVRSSQTIEFGQNLIDLSEYVNASEVYTYLIPQGKKDEETRKRVDITSVNDGKNYICSEVGKKLYGNIYRTLNWDDVTQPENLLRKARQTLDKAVEMATTITIKAVDLHLLHVDVQQIELGNEYRVISKPHDLDQYFLCSKIKLDLANPQNSEYTFGCVTSSLTENQVKTVTEMNDQIFKQSTRRQEAMKNLFEQITGAKSGCRIDEYDENGMWIRELIMDSTDKATAVNVMQRSTAGIMFSHNGYDGPYTSAWGINGEFIADNITSGTMSADRIRGGELLSDNYDASKKIGTRWDLNTGFVDCHDFNLDDYLKYNAEGFETGAEKEKIYMLFGGWQVKKTTVEGEPAEYLETIYTQENGIGSCGPWVVWGGWNGKGAFNKANYAFVIDKNGECKVTNLINSSRAELKQDIRDYEDGALEKILSTKVYRYQLKQHGKDNDGKHIGFVIGDEYPLTEDAVDYSKSGIDLYAAVAIAYKAIQELTEKVQSLEEDKKHE